MKRFSERAGYSTMAELNITPLLDLAFVLLIIFVITTPLIEQGIELKLPTASEQSSTPLKPSTVHSVAIDRSGAIFFQKQKMSPSQLEASLKRLKKLEPEAAVVVRADRELRYQQLVNVLDALKRAGISKMGLVNNPEHEGGSR